MQREYLKGLFCRLRLLVPICLLICFPINLAFAESIKAGVLLPLTGRLGKLGHMEKKSFLLAMEEINGGGGVRGKKIELVFEDTKGTPDVAKSAIEKLIFKDKVSVVGGGYASSATWISSTLAQQHKIPFLINTASADKITEQDWDYIFRITPPLSEHSVTLSSFIKQLNDIKTMAIVQENTPFGEFWSKKFVKLWKESELKLVGRVHYELGTSDFTPLLIRLKEKTPDLVYMISHVKEASLLMRQMGEIQMEPKLFLGHEAGFIHPEFLRDAGNTSEFVYVHTIWTPAVPYPFAKEYYVNFFSKYGSYPDYHGAQAYAAMYVIFDALKRAKTLTPKDIRDALAETDLMTAFGPVRFLSYGKKRQQNRLPTSLVQWLSGKLETVWPHDIATAKYLHPAPSWGQR